VTASLTNILSAVATVSHPEWDEAVLAYKSTGTSALTSVTYNLAASSVSVVTLSYDADDKIITVTKT
jgi:1-aminocyclopropane-1-carboxylate deaminase/D-cysteine desulfhydrase-like pyridoxal-dependent ACC family enzyme